ncbi:iron ABC transporter permease [Acidisoma cellulosilytica]|uniref:Iron ABC transporter permease n=1 Tax=Acidisoma cellulosilyticum TaxID=2802395 RepID=A0A963Z4K1_9PROT|nr:iron ABC transporter permease [Acidisoma cellulosilyticum]MCB8882411.1 iron ABC transporter permease [Acidisoma cellulosilyticum]
MTTQASAATPPGIAAHYRRTVLGRGLLLAVVILLGLAAMVADLIVGSGTLTLAQVAGAIFHPSQADPTTRAILWDIRAPITLLAAVTGMELALSGSLLQTALRNPLAEPFTLGIAAAAGFGAAIAIVFQTSIFQAGIFESIFAWMPSELFVSGNAFVFSLLTVVLITLLAGRRGMRVETITLLGIAVHFTFSALLAFAQYFADATQLQSLVFWLLGSLLRATWLKVWINTSVLVALLPVLLLQSWSLTALRGFGEQAVVLGIRVARLRFLLMICAALMAGAATASIGIVGFIGLVAPHMARLLVGEDQRFALPLTAACGMLILTLASLVSKIVLPGVILPIGMITSLLGIPFFLALILGNRRQAGV